MNQETSPAPSAMPPTPSRKQGMSTGCVITLVVGLVIAISIAVLAVLAALGVASGKKVIGKARDLQARSVMKGLEIAIEGYRTEYLRPPLQPDPPPTLDGDVYDSSEPGGRTLLDVLLAVDVKQNPRQIRFWEPPPSRGSAGYSASGGLVDPWGRNGYRILLDDNNDGHIADPEKVRGNISGSVLIYSAGPDGDFITWSDNVCSWK